MTDTDRDAYEARKERYMKDGIPFMSYLHANGWMFMRLDKIPFSPNENRVYDSAWHGNLKRAGSTVQVGPRGKKGFDRIVNRLRKDGVLLDVTYHLQEAVTAHAI